jgi:hypothetical protein
MHRHTDLRSSRLTGCRTAPVGGALCRLGQRRRMGSVALPGVPGDQSQSPVRPEVRRGGGERCALGGLTDESSRFPPQLALDMVRTALGQMPARPVRSARDGGKVSRGVFDGSGVRRSPHRFRAPSLPAAGFAGMILTG